MKPLLLTIEGINSFDAPRTIDFAELARNNIFCICGPTGSGKTTILDCIILALYAPSNHNRGTLKDYIHTGSDKGKITLRFSADGTVYEVYRELRRNASSTAKLTNFATGEVLADKADTVTARIKDMLKLDKDDFTKVVVLEQGKYAEFMSLSKTARCTTVSKLFSLERFDRLKDTVAAAKNKYEKAIGEMTAALAQYEGDTEAVLADKKKELAQLKKEAQTLQKEEEAAQAEVSAGEQLQAQAARRTQAQAQAKEADARLQTIAAQTKAWEKEAQAHREAAEKTEEWRKKSEAAHALLSLVDACEHDEKEAVQKQARREALLKDYEKNSKQAKACAELCETLFRRENELRKEISATEKERDDALAAYERARTGNAAALLRLSLRDGDVCPVCGGAYHDRAHEERTQDEKALAAYKAAWEKSERTLKSCNEELRKNLQSRAVAEANRAAAEKECENIKAQGQNTAQEIAALSAKLGERLGGKTAAQARKEANGDIAAYETALRKEREKADEIRAAQTDLAAQRAAWREKADAAQRTLAELSELVFDEKAYAAAVERLAQCRARAARLASDTGSAQERIASLQTRLAKKKELQRRKKKYGERLDDILILHKCTEKGNKLLSFVADSYMQSFTEAAGETLRSLTNGKYSLVYDDGDFYVKDFFADNATRKVKTLSGGETFLASMSIAMAISRQIATQNYEFFFLDEGFGTLHERAVETVMNALNALSRDTIVGIVTHRSELSERIASRLTVIPATETEGSDVVMSDM